MFLNYIHRFRGIAILFIISGHCIRYFNWKNSPQMEHFFRAIMLNGTVMFVFIAGFLFQHLSDRYTYRLYLLNKFKNIIIPYIVVSIPMIIYLVFIERLGNWTHPGLNEKPYLYQVTWFYLTGKHLAPLWFIPMMSIFYLLYPFFIMIDKNETAYYLILPVTIIISLLVHRPPAESNLIHVFLYFFSVYLFGMWFSHYKEKIFSVVDKKKLLLLILILIILCIEIFFYKHSGVIYVKNMFFHNKELLDINLLQKIILSILFMSLLKNTGHFINKNTFLNKVLDNFASLSFGIYFIHYYFIEALLRSKRVFQYEFVGNFFYLIVLIIVIATFCIMSLKLSKVVLGSRSRYIIGA